MIAAKVLGAHAHQHRSVAVYAVAGVQAHAVHVHAVCLAGGVDHLTAGAHAEGVHTALIGRGHVELVLSRRQRRMPGGCAVLCAVDVALQVLDTRADGKGLGLHGQSQIVQPLVGIARAVADGQEHMVGFDLFLARHGGAHTPVAQPKARELHAEAHLAAQVDELCARALEHPAQFVGADMRALGKQNILRCAAAHEGFEHGADLRAIEAAGELAV